jgi:hypothetical protein
MGQAPSDALPRKSWPMWRKILAYLLMFALASVSIWEIDRLAMRQTQGFNSDAGLAGPGNK